ncbi:MAG: exodeoxyribonuclease III [Patescibacteria group bacterium]|nr:exodeoxyribonuclease III [Patescibacteria group bacterium]
MMRRIVSWNVNGLRANAKKGGFDWIINESPDIFCFQETKAHPDQLDPGVRSPAGYHSYFDHSRVKKGYSGVAVYSKIEPDEVEYGLGVERYDQEGRFLGLFYHNDSLGIGVDKLALLNIYFPNGGGGPDRLKYKLGYYDEFLRYIVALKKKGYEVIFCGDVNTAHEEVDLARPKENEENTGFLPIERAWIDRVVTEGYADVFRHFHPGSKGAYTYWDMKTFARERNVGWRIDYFFASEKALNKIDKARILDEIMGSDHCPIDIYIG